jgi:hypothetical protein
MLSENYAVVCLAKTTGRSYGAKYLGLCLMLQTGCPFRACSIIPFTRGFTPGYILSALRACCRAKRLFALQGKVAEGNTPEFLLNIQKEVKNDIRRTFKTGNTRIRIQAPI